LELAADAALRQPWGDGTTHVVFEPVEFLGRLAVLVPRPRVNRILYYGVLGARAAWRREVVPGPTSRQDPAAGDPVADASPAAVIGRILRHLGLPTDVPVARPARAPPLHAVAGDAQVDVDEPAP
jgi:hypothetical protein